MAEHNTLSGASLHEPKGIAALNNTSDVDKTYKSDGAGSGSWGFPEPKGADTAVSGAVYTSDGAGSGTWVSPSEVPNGNLFFTDETVGTPSDFSATTTWTKLDDLTLSIILASSNLSEMTYADGRLTYIGSTARPFIFNSSFSFDHAAGANRIIQLSLYKNGVIIPQSFGVSEVSSGTIASVSLSANGSLDTNDYIEVFCRTTNSTATIQFYSIYGLAFALS